jgi:hypothetical protein
MIRPRIIYILISIFLSGCAASVKNYVYNDSMSISDAAKIIEQIIMEQPSAHRPESVYITEDYVLYGDGILTTEKVTAIGVPIGNSAIIAGREQSKTKSISERIYFNSFGKAELFQRRKWFIVQVRDKAGYTIRNFFTRDEKMAEQFIDAMYSMKRNSLKK